MGAIISEHNSRTLPSRDPAWHTRRRKAFLRENFPPVESFRAGIAAAQCSAHEAMPKFRQNWRGKFRRTKQGLNL
eukprot:256141-Amorphochlora_amoeboformis.AAC.1